LKQILFALLLLLWSSCGFAQALSPPGTTLVAGERGTLITSEGSWTFNTDLGPNQYAVLLNNNQVGSTPTQKIVVGSDGKVYAQNADSSWWVWNGAVWVTSSEPTLPPPSPPPPPAPVPTVRILAVQTQVVITWACTESTSSVGKNFETGGLIIGSRAFDTTETEFAVTCIGPGGSVTSTTSVVPQPAPAPPPTPTRSDISPSGSALSVADLLLGNYYPTSLITNAGKWTFGTETNDHGNAILLDEVPSGGNATLLLRVGADDIYANSGVLGWWRWRSGVWEPSISPYSG
jgi:hypothetical protein